MQFLKKITFRHREIDVNADAFDNPKQSSSKKNKKRSSSPSTPVPAPGDPSLIVIRSNNGYAGDMNRSYPKQSSICGLSMAANGKPHFATQSQFSTWPEDEFNDTPSTYVEPTNQQEDEYDSPDEQEHHAHSHSHHHHRQHNIGQTGFFGNEGSCSSGGSAGGADELVVPPSLPPPLQQQQQLQPQSSPRHSNNIDCSLNNGGNNNNNSSNKLALGIQRAVSSAASTTSQHYKQKAALPNRSGLSSGASSNIVSRHESVKRRSSSTIVNSASIVAVATIERQASQPSPVSSSTTSGDEPTTSSSSSSSQQTRSQHLPQRPQPKVLGSRFCEGLDPNKVVAGIQTMVKMNQPGAKVPPTPPKPSSLNQSRYIQPPQIVTPPDSDECEPELPSRIKSIMVNSNNNSDVGAASPSPPSSEASSSGPVIVVLHPKKRQAPPPPSSKMSVKTTASPAITLKITNDTPLPPPAVTDFKVAVEVNNKPQQPPVVNKTNAPSISSSSSGGSSDDLLPLPPPAVAPKDLATMFKQRQVLKHTTSSPITIASSSPNTNNTAFANRPSNSSTSGVSSSLQSSAASSTSGSAIKIPVNMTPKVLIKVPAQPKPLDVATTSFTSGKVSQPSVVKTPSVVQVTVVSSPSSGNSEANGGYNNGSTSTGTGPSYASDEEIYSGAESMPYNLFTFEWYHGKMTREDSERRLRENGQEGAFLLRDCNNSALQPNALFTLCLFARGACHYIQVCQRPEANGRLAVGSQKDSEKTFATLQELVQFHMNEAPLVVQPRGTHNEPHPQHFLCSLKYPIIRRD